jgi:hypothetical protein
MDTNRDYPIIVSGSHSRRISTKPVKVIYEIQGKVLGRACSTNGEDEECIEDIGGKP